MPDDQSLTMEELLKGLAITVAVLERHGVNYALIGGMAAGYRSQARFTKDLDFLMQISQVSLPGLLESLAEEGYQFDLLPTIREWLDHHMVALSFRGFRVDLLKAIIPAYQHVLDRATEEVWLGSRIRMASAEGLILMKLVAARTQDWLDIENLVAAQRSRLDLDWIRDEWRVLAGEDDPRMARLLDLVVRAREID